jgi:hypothetical protein
MICWSWNHELVINNQEDEVKQTLNDERREILIRGYVLPSIEQAGLEEACSDGERIIIDKLLTCQPVVVKRVIMNGRVWKVILSSKSVKRLP